MRLGVVGGDLETGLPENLIRPIGGAVCSCELLRNPTNGQRDELICSGIGDDRVVKTAGYCGLAVSELCCRSVANPASTNGGKVRTSICWAGGEPSICQDAGLADCRWPSSATTAMPMGALLDQPAIAAFALLHAPVPPALGERAASHSGSGEEEGPGRHCICSCAPSTWNAISHRLSGDTVQRALDGREEPVLQPVLDVPVGHAEDHAHRSVAGIVASRRLPGKQPGRPEPGVKGGPRHLQLQFTQGRLPERQSLLVRRRVSFALFFRCTHLRFQEMRRRLAAAFPCHPVRYGRSRQ